MQGQKQTLPPRTARRNGRLRPMSMETEWWSTGEKCLTNKKEGHRWRCLANSKHPINHRVAGLWIGCLT